MSINPRPDRGQPQLWANRIGWHKGKDEQDWVEEGPRWSVALSVEGQSGFAMWVLKGLKGSEALVTGSWAVGWGWVRDYFSAGRFRVLVLVFPRSMPAEPAAQAVNTTVRSANQNNRLVWRRSTDGV